MAKKIMIQFVLRINSPIYHLKSKFGRGIKNYNIEFNAKSLNYDDLKNYSLDVSTLFS